jgi:hypothetical protein
VSRSGGFLRADISVALLRDPKVRRVRAMRGGDTAVLTYLGIVLASWEAGERLTAAEAGESARLTYLLEVGMLDAELRVPENVWEDWFGPAERRREARAEAGRLGGLAKASHAVASSNGLAKPQQSAAQYITSTDQPVINPLTPAERGNGLRSTGRSPRQLAAAEASRRREQVNRIRIDYAGGRLTEAERDARLAEFRGVPA